MVLPSELTYKPVGFDNLVKRGLELSHVAEPAVVHSVPSPITVVKTLLYIILTL